MSAESDIVNEAKSIADFLHAQSQVLPKDTFDAVQQGQVNSLGAKISAMGACGLAGATDLTAAISRGPWTPDQKSFLCSRVSDRLTTQQASLSQPRKTQQSLTASLPNYFTPSDYEFFRDHSQMLHSKIARACDRLCRVGISCPSEATTRHFVAFLLVNAVQDVSVSMQSQHAMVTEVKMALKASAKSHPFPFPHLRNFPMTPTELPPAVYEHCYASEAPVKDRPVDNMSSIATQVPMRNTHKGIRPQHDQLLPHMQQMAQLPQMFQQFMQVMSAAMPQPAGQPLISMLGQSASSSSSAPGLFALCDGISPPKRLRTSVASSGLPSASTFTEADYIPAPDGPNASDSAASTASSPQFHRSLWALASPTTGTPQHGAPDAVGSQPCPPVFSAAHLALPAPAGQSDNDDGVGMGSPGLAETSVPDMHTAVHKAMAKREAAKLAAAVRKRPAAAPQSSKPGHPGMPNLEGPANPPAVFHGLGKIYTSLSKGNFRVIRRIGDRVDVTVRWKADVANAWTEALAAIDNDDR